ncbi:glycosyltransferase family 1 protein [Bacillus sp. ISL-18]|uniref:glycosyltransferase family 1 protein n=1 Tax=Bacillus sp. ISL-18 TaxID=2819118 RepID=UPI001BE91AB3|nr:glycosyltransferase family 1 protein [Bacillus sp. ISL-18]MBT2657081.1 glycosyltransferase family 1 protein [Bacillus sp. ISL-18]
MSKITCCIRLGEVPLHLYNITAGFQLLKKNGIIDLKVEKLNANEKLPYNMMEVIVNNQYRVLYDVNDGYDNLLTEKQDYVRFMNNLLNSYDYYFKRSFSRKYNENLCSNHKMYPLGLNYMVTIPRNISHSPTKQDPKKDKIKKMVRMLPFSEYYNGQYYVHSFEDIPTIDLNPKILFMARLWDINGDTTEGISLDKKEERIFINELRVNCIRLCKKEFGDQFFGGISPSRFASENYPDVIINDKAITKRNNYIKKVKESSICVATMGLHESIGWKFAEYIAASRAIVTEELHYEVPGNLLDKYNYLTFKTAEECVEQIYRLINNAELRYQMMINNFNYYHQFVRPDRLVLNSIMTVLNKGGIKHEANPNNIHTYI